LGSAAGSVASAASYVDGSVPALLSLDFCSRLYVATADQVIAISPYTEAGPAANAKTFLPSSGQQRLLYADAAGQFAFMSPYVGLADRGIEGVDTNAFASADKVIRLHDVQVHGSPDDGSVHAAASMPAENWCTDDELYALEDTSPSENCDGRDAMMSPCQVKGCWRESTRCSKARVGWFTADGATEEECPADVSCPAEFPACYLYYAFQWPNSSCPFICEQADLFQSDRRCRIAPEGYYSPRCNNKILPCEMPEDVSQELFLALTRFTTSGRGEPSGCAAQLAFPLARAGHVDPLEPPFTVELWVKIAPDDMPHAGVDAPRLAILTGTFPRWFVALRRASTSSAHLCFYHEGITRAVSSRQDSFVCSEVLSWSEAWRHVAVVVTSKDHIKPNVHFYSNGELVSSASRAAVPVSAPDVHPDQLDIFHIGAPNLRLFPEVLVAGRTEPYFFDAADTQTFFSAEVDEVRVSRSALQGMAQGAFLTELRRRAACDVPFERLEGSTCRPVARFTLAHAEPDQSSCQDDFEPCGARPGLCVAKCKQGTLRQADCTCDCPAGEFQTWMVQAVHLTGSGSIYNVTVYDATHRIVAQVEGDELPQR